MKLITLNIEGNKHINRIVPFITKESPDVLCLQEVDRADFERLRKLGYYGTFLPMTIKKQDGANSEEGIALYTRDIQKNIHAFYYSKLHIVPTHFNDANIPNSVINGVIFVDFINNNQLFTVGTTHFTWTPDGDKPGVEQISDMESFLSHITQEKPHVMCGDFNIPRYMSFLYKELTKYYADTIPKEYSASLDKELHRLGQDPAKQKIFDSFMVDYVFTQSPYRATDVKLEFGLSDHAAVVATISKE